MPSSVAMPPKPQSVSNRSPIDGVLTDARVVTGVDRNHQAFLWMVEEEPVEPVTDPGGKPQIFAVTERRVRPAERHQ